MKQSRKIFGPVFAAAVIAALLLLVSCGSDNGSNSGDDDRADVIISLAVYDSELYAAGNFGTDDNSVTQVRKFTGTGWEVIGTGFNSGCYDLCPGDSGLYASGEFTDINGVAANHIARWDGTVWHPLGTGLTGGTANCLLRYQGYIMVGGSFTSAGGNSAQHFAAWAEPANEWMQITAPMSVNIDGLAVFSSFLFAGGNAVATTNWHGHIYFFGGTSWNELVELNGPFGAIGVWDNRLLVGGHFDSVGSVAANNIASFNLSAWSPLGSGLGGDMMTVSAFADFNGDLIVGGTFETAGGDPSLNVARWDGAEWHPMGAGLRGYVYTLVVHNGVLTAGGDFRSSSSFVKTIGCLARWNGTTWTIQ